MKRPGSLHGSLEEAEKKTQFKQNLTYENNDLFMK